MSCACTGLQCIQTMPRYLFLVWALPFNLNPNRPGWRQLELNPVSSRPPHSYWMDEWLRAASYKWLRTRTKEQGSGALRKAVTPVDGQLVIKITKMDKQTSVMVYFTVLYRQTGDEKPSIWRNIPLETEFPLLIKSNTSLILISEHINIKSDKFELCYHWIPSFGSIT